MNRLAGKNACETADMANEYNKLTQLVIANKNSPADCASGELVAQRLGANFIVTYGDRYDYYFDLALKRWDYTSKTTLLIGGYNAIPEWIEGWILDALGESPHTKHYSYRDLIDDRDTHAVKYGIPMEYWGNAQKQLDNLEVIGKELGYYPVIRSGYRSPGFNADVGGSKHSDHLECRATDTYMPDYEPNTFTYARAVQANVKLRGLYNAFGWGANINIHQGNRENGTHWWYKYKSWDEWERNQ